MVSILSYPILCLHNYQDRINLSYVVIVHDLTSTSSGATIGGAIRGSGEGLLDGVLGGVINLGWLPSFLSASDQSSLSSLDVVGSSSGFLRRCSCRFFFCSFLSLLRSWFSAFDALLCASPAKRAYTRCHSFWHTSTSSSIVVTFFN